MREREREKEQNECQGVEPAPTPSFFTYVLMYVTYSITTNNNMSGGYHTFHFEAAQPLPLEPLSAHPSPPSPFPPSI